MKSVGTEVLFLPKSEKKVGRASGGIIDFCLLDHGRYDIIDIKYIIWKLSNGFTDTDQGGQRTKG